MTKPAPHSFTRRAERAKLRQGPPWRFRDALPFGVLLLVALLGIFAPAILADIGDTVLGSDQWRASIDTSPSSLFLALSRGTVVLLIGYMLWNTREAPLQQRWGWVLVGIAICMNYARNYYSGNPSTLSFEIGLLGLGWLVSRLAVRPTIHERLSDAETRAKAETARADAAEAEVRRLRGEG